MGIKYLWDTNTTIYYLQQQFPLSAEQFVDGILSLQQPVLSAITEIELLCWKSATDQDLKTMENFISDALVIELEPAIKRQAAEVRKTDNTKLPDAIIAATALVFDFTLLSRNTSDFNRIAGLKLINPWDQ